MRHHHTETRKAFGELCAEVSEGDGVDPHVRSRTASLGGPKGGHPPSKGEGLDRKALQLCHQVAETLEEVLAECGDTVLQALRVLDVEPAPDASRLLVTVAPDEFAPDDMDPHRIHEHLSRASGHLRAEVAGAITRKRTPVLVYRLAAQAF